MKHFFQYFSLSCTMMLAANIAPNVATAAEPIRVSGEATGPSELDTLKTAYTEVMAQALAIQAPADFTQPFRQTLTREVREDPIRVKTRFLQGIPNETCSETSTYDYRCSVTALVKAKELMAWLRTELNLQGANRLKVAIQAPKNEMSRELVERLRTGLERDFGYDAYVVQYDNIDANALRNQCTPIEATLNRYNNRGAGFQSLASQLRNKLNECQSMLDREVLLTVSDIQLHKSKWNSITRSMDGDLTFKTELVSLASDRSLATPEPQVIQAAGFGESSAAAERQLKQKAFEKTVNYMYQQLNGIFASTHITDNVVANLSGSDFQLEIHGLKQNNRHDRQTAGLIRNYFRQNMQAQLDTVQDTSEAADQLYTVRPAGNLDWMQVEDELYQLLEDQGLKGSIDTDQNQTMIISFEQDKDMDSQSKSSLTSDGIEVVFHKKRKFLVFSPILSVEDQQLHKIRRDQRTGFDVNLKEAVITLKNNTGKPMAIALNPTWKSTDSGRLLTLGSGKRTVEIPKKSSLEVVIEAPSRHAETVSVALDYL